MIIHYLCLAVCQAFKVYWCIFKRDRGWDDFSHKYSLMLGDITHFFHTTMPVCISPHFLLTSYLWVILEHWGRHSTGTISLLISLFRAVRCHTVSATQKSGWAMYSITFHMQRRSLPFHPSLFLHASMPGYLKTSLKTLCTILRSKVMENDFFNSTNTTGFE